MHVGRFESGCHARFCLLFGLQLFCHDEIGKHETAILVRLRLDLRHAQVPFSVLDGIVKRQLVLLPPELLDGDRFII